MDCLIIDPPGESLGTLVFLHGLGADGHDFEPVARQLMPALPLRWVLPNAPVMPVSINGGYPMPAWYDITDLSRPDGVEWSTVQRTRAAIHGLLREEAERGPRRLLLGGFSQGGAITLRSGFDAPVPLAGLVVLSGYLLRAVEEVGVPGVNKPEAAPPVFMAHGTQDDVLPLPLAQAGRDALRAAGVRLDWRTYPMGHALCPREAQDLVAFLNGIMRPA